MQFGKSLQERPATERKAIIRHRQNVAKTMAGLGLVAGVTLGLVESGNGSIPSVSEAIQQSQDLHTLRGELVLNPGVNLHNTLETPEDVATDNADPGNGAGQIKPGEALVVQDPVVITRTNGEGTSTIWYAFQKPQHIINSISSQHGVFMDKVSRNPKNPEWVAIDGSDPGLKPQDYQVFMENGDTIILGSPQANDLSSAKYRQPVLFVEKENSPTRIEAQGAVSYFATPAEAVKAAEFLSGKEG